VDRGHKIGEGILGTLASWQLTMNVRGSVCGLGEAVLYNWRIPHTLRHIV